MNNNKLEDQITHFSRWTRKKWAAFASLRKVIKISFLSATLSLVSFIQKGEAQSLSIAPLDTIEDLKEVEVTGALSPSLYNELSRTITVILPSQIELAPVKSINDLLSSLPQVDIRQRGPLAIQSDISIRGSHFDQVLILLNGISINNIQTGHHNLDLPISLEEIERIEIIAGPAARVYGPDAFAGAINIITKKNIASQIGISVSMGDFGLKSMGIYTGFKTKLVNHYFSIGTEGSTGYAANTDFQNSRIFYSANYNHKKTTLDFQSAFSTKNFGAASFYSPKYPNQFESTQKAFGALSLKRAGKINLQLALFFRNHHDKFELFRIEENAPNWYKTHNYHQTISTGINSKAFIYNKIGKISAGFNFKFSEINSNVLGKITNDTLPSLIWEDGFYTKYDYRNEFSFFVEQIIQWKQWRIAAGLMANHLTNQNSLFTVYPGIDFSRAITPSSRLYATINTAMRQPTFTDLYYQGPTNIGNPELMPETSINYEIGYNLTKENIGIRISIFNVIGRNTIDWVRLTDSVKWQPMNISITKNYGIESSINWKPRLNPTINHLFKSINLSYKIQDSKRCSGAYQSNYISDFVRSKFDFELHQQIIPNLNLIWNYSFIDRQGYYFLYNPITQKETETLYGKHHLVNFKIKYSFKNGDAYMIIMNLTNTKYYDYGNIPAPSRWFSFGLNYRFSC